MPRSHSKKGGSKTKARQSVMAAKARRLSAPYTDLQQFIIRTEWPNQVPPPEVLDRIADEKFWDHPKRGGSTGRLPGWAQNVGFRKDGQIDRRTICINCRQALPLAGPCDCGIQPGHGQQAVTALLVARKWGILESEAQLLIDRLVGAGKPLDVLLDRGVPQQNNGRRRPAGNPRLGKQATKK